MKWKYFYSLLYKNEVMYSGEIPEEFLAKYPYSPTFKISSEFIVKDDIEYVQVRSGLADVFELELSEPSIILFTNKEITRKTLIKINVPAGKYKFLRTCIPYVYIYVEKGINHTGERWISKDADLYRSLYNMCIIQTINEVTFYYYDGFINSKPSKDFDSNTTNNNLEKLIAIKFLSSIN